MTPVDVNAVRTLLRPQAIGWSLRHVPECSSTQDLAKEAIGQGAGEGWVVSSDYQRAGRGRRGASWVAPPGSALLASLVLEPPSSLTPLSPLLAGVAVVDGIEAACGLRADLKWPNDVMVGVNKLAGILVEHPPGRPVIIGIGVNVTVEASAFPARMAATSLLIELGRAVPVEGLLAAILTGLDTTLSQAGRGGPGWVIDAWRQRTSMLGQSITYEVGGREQRGIAEDLTDDGALLVRRGDGTVEPLYAGAVRRVRKT
jgi:BirA family transcriptional regulator, biotin operon repressor / biotin---[acetyl-CoA-carboxylase] ligase